MSDIRKKKKKKQGPPHFQKRKPSSLPFRNCNRKNLLTTRGEKKKRRPWAITVTARPYTEKGVPEKGSLTVPLGEGRKNGEKRVWMRAPEKKKMGFFGPGAGLPRLVAGHGIRKEGERQSTQKKYVQNPVHSEGKKERGLFRCACWGEKKKKRDFFPGPIEKGGKEENLSSSPNPKEKSSLVSDDRGKKKHGLKKVSPLSKKKSTEKANLNLVRKQGAGKKGGGGGEGQGKKGPDRKKKR